MTSLFFKFLIWNNKCKLDLFHTSLNFETICDSGYIDISKHMGDYPTIQIVIFGTIPLFRNIHILDSLSKIHNGLCSVQYGLDVLYSCGSIKAI